MLTIAMAVTSLPATAAQPPAAANQLIVRQLETAPTAPVVAVLTEETALQAALIAAAAPVATAVAAAAVVLAAIAVADTVVAPAAAAALVVAVVAVRQAVAVIVADQINISHTVY